jgi:hypothetical protein
MPAFRVLQPEFDVAQFGISVQYVLDAPAAVGRGLLRHVRDDPVCGHPQLASVRPDLPEKQREQAGLAAAVGTRDTDFLPRVNLHAYIFEEATRAAAKR